MLGSQMNQHEATPKIHCQDPPIGVAHEETPLDTPLDLDTPGSSNSANMSAELGWL